MSDARRNKSARTLMIEKAVWLLVSGRVVKISDYMYYVMGRKNRHIVKVENGVLTCTCPGFKERKMCSHIIAVSTIRSLPVGTRLLEQAIRERVKRELREMMRGGIVYR